MTKLPTLDLDRLERLEREATPGPWTKVHQCKRYGCNAVMVDLDAGHNGDEDSALITEARNALPELLAYVRRLERVAEAARKAAEIIEDAADADPYIMPRGSADELKEALAALD